MIGPLSRVPNAQKATAYDEGVCGQNCEKSEVRTNKNSLRMLDAQQTIKIGM
jgi:hypothetical protein